MKHSVSEVAELLHVDRRTLQRWVKRKKIPVPAAGIVNGRLVKFWDETGIRAIEQYKAAAYCGKGLDRRSGKAAKRK